MSMEDHFWMSEPSLERREVDALSYLEMGGIAYYGPVSDKFDAFMGCAPGTEPSLQGKMEEHQGLALASQSQLNALVGNVYAWKNAQYPRLNYYLSSAFKNLDIAPQEIISANLSIDDTPKRITFTEKPFIPQEITWTYKSKNKTLLQSVTMHEVTEGFDGDTIIIPDEPPKDIPPRDTIPPIIIPPIIVIPPTLSGDIFVASANAIKTTPDFAVSTGTTWIDKTSNLTGTFIIDACYDETDTNNDTFYVAADSGIYKTTNFQTDPPTWTKVYDAGTGSASSLDPQVRRVVMSPASGNQVYALLNTREAVASSTAKTYVLYSSNAGGSWGQTELETNPDAVEDFKVDKQTTSINKPADWWYGHGYTTHRREDEHDDVNPWGVAINVINPNANLSNFAFEYRTSQGIPAPESAYINSFFNSTPTQKALPLTGINKLYLTPAEEIEMGAYFNTYFGNGAWIEAAESDSGKMIKDPDRVRLGIGLAGAKDPPYVQGMIGYVFWRMTNYDTARAIDCGQQDALVVYVGGELGIYRSEDGGATFELLIEDKIVHDIECYVPQPPYDPQTKCYRDNGGAYTTFDTYLMGNAWHIETDPLDVPLRIASHDTDGWPAFLLSHNGGEDFNLVKCADSSETVRQTDITLGRSVKQKDDVIYWLEASDICFSDDDGMTKTSRKGDWTDFGSPVVIIPLNE